MADLGCGEGAVTASLARRWPTAHVTGIDSSATMLAAAAAHAVPGRTRCCSGFPTTSDCSPTGRPTWHLADGSACTFGAPTHTLLADLCRLAPVGGRAGRRPPGADSVLEPAGDSDALSAGGLVADVWETTYLHLLTGPDPVSNWVRSTQLRPVLARLGEHDAGEFTAGYAAARREACPIRPDGSTLLPFRRIFAVASRPV